MTSFTSFTMSLQPRTTPDWETGEATYTVLVEATGHYFQPLRCEGRSVREAYDEANAYIASLLSHLCEGCANTVEGYDETFRNCGMCQSCYDEMTASKKG